MSAPTLARPATLPAAFDLLRAVGLRAQIVDDNPRHDAASRPCRKRNWWVRSRAWMSMLIMAPFAVLALLSEPSILRPSWADVTCDVLGWTCFVAGAAIRWWATLHIGGNKTSLLVTSGPYSLCRNPLYLGTLLLVLAVASFLKSLTLAGGVVVASIYYLAITVPAEERYLRHRLGRPYLEYCQRVPRFLPRLATFEAPTLIEVRRAGLVAEAWRAARWMWIPVVCEMISQARLEAWWPKLTNLP